MPRVLFSAQASRCHSSAVVSRALKSSPKLLLNAPCELEEAALHRSLLAHIHKWLKVSTYCCPMLIGVRWSVMGSTHVSFEACSVAKPFLAFFARVDLQLVWSIVNISSSSFLRLPPVPVQGAIHGMQATTLHVVVDIGDFWRCLGLPLRVYGAVSRIPLSTPMNLLLVLRRSDGRVRHF